MKWVALATWVLTAGGGFAMLGLWLKHGGMQAGADGDRDRIRPPRIFTHFALAAVGLVLWIVYVASGTDALAWVAVALLVVVALLGFSMFATWLRQRGAGTPRAGSGPEPAERHFPTGVVGVHGVLAATTLVLALLVAAGVGS